MIGPRNFNSDPYGNGWGALTVVPSLWETYQENDPRRTATILSYDDEGLSYDYDGQGQAQYTGYTYKKYELVSSGGSVRLPNWQWDNDEDYMVIRFADVLLMGAELNLLTGNSATALEYTNRVRSRAFGDDSENYSSITLEDIQNERRLELAGEGIRYYDILRSCEGDFSRLVDILTYVDDTDGGDFSQTNDVQSLDVDGNNFVETKGLYQIPQNELDLMEDIIQQNPGYTSGE
jgi:hypothetical protein